MPREARTRSFEVSEASQSDLYTLVWYNVMSKGEIDMFARYRRNARKPEGLGGRLILTRMNRGGHADLSEWGFSLFPDVCCGRALDVGCGGGANVKRLLKRFDGAKVCGLDHSDVSVAKTLRHNRRAVKDGRCEVALGDVTAMPYADGVFDVVTAFETVYFWQPIGRAFAEIFRVLKEGGVFMICNDADGETSDWDEIEKQIGDMKVYTAAQLQNELERAGFNNIDVHRRSGTSCLCVIARK